MAARRINAVPLTEREFRRLSQATMDSGVVPHPLSPGDHLFFLLWLAGTFAPPLTGFLAILLAPSGGAALLLMLGLAIGLTNLTLACATDWYRAGDWSTLGRQFARATGWTSAALIGTFFVLVMLMLVLVFAAMVVTLDHR
ncbi:hypothetical protein BH23CHL2_BH23CHL2_19610 [soil metagenome]